MGTFPTMPYKRMIPTVLVALTIPLVGWAQAPAPAPAPETPSLADNVIAETIIKVRLRERIAASIVQDVSMLNQKFKMEGTYYRDTDHRLRLQLDLVGLGDSSSTMLQVCDGKVLWEYQKVLGMQSYRKLRLEPIFEKLASPVLDDVFRSLVNTQLGFGGPEAMLMGLQKSIKFDKFSEEKVDGIDSYVLGGKWKNREGLVGPGERPLPPTGPLPPYIPSDVVVCVDKVAMWPFKVEMVGSTPLMLPGMAQQDIDVNTGRLVGQKKAPPKVEPTKILLRYTLRPESEIKPDEMFAFQAPKDAPNVNDAATKDFLDFLDQAIQTQVNVKRAEAAKAEGEVPPITPLNPPVQPDPVTKPNPKPPG